MSNRKTIKLTADYGCWPLWNVGKDGDNIDPEILPLSPEAIEKLKEWAEAYERTLNQEYPPDSNFESIEQLNAFNRLGRELLRQLRRELGSEYDIVYKNLYDPDTAR